MTNATLLYVPLGMVTRSIEKIKEREAELMAALDWFKQDKAPLVHNKDPGVIQLKENMKERARVRQSVLDSTNGDIRTFFPFLNSFPNGKLV